MWFVRIGLFLSLAVVSFSHLKLHFPPSADGFLPRVVIRKPIPRLYELTLCVWIKPYSVYKYHESYYYMQDSTIFSYASHRTDNEYNCLICNKGIAELCFDIGGPTIIFGCPHLTWQDGEWYHICNTWFGSSGHMKTYVNGKVCLHNNNEVGIISPNNSIRGDGVFVIGQEQDGMDSRYEHVQAFHGDIADLNLWNEVLTEKQIIEAGKCNHNRRKGNVIAGLKTRMTAINVTISETKLCERQSK